MEDCIFLYKKEIFQITPNERIQAECLLSAEAEINVLTYNLVRKIPNYPEYLVKSDSATFLRRTAKKLTLKGHNMLNEVL